MYISNRNFAPVGPVLRVEEVEDLLIKKISICTEHGGIYTSMVVTERMEVYMYIENGGMYGGICI